MQCVKVNWMLVWDLMLLNHVSSVYDSPISHFPNQLSFSGIEFIYWLKVWS